MSESELDPAAQRQIDDLAHGNPGVAKSLRQSLDRLAAGAGGADLQEMARDVLAGRIGLRKAALSRVYGQHLEEGVQRFADYFNSLDAQQQRDLRDAGREQLRRLAEEPS